MSVKSVTNKTVGTTISSSVTVYKWQDNDSNSVIIHLKHKQSRNGLAADHRHSTLNSPNVSLEIG